MKMTGHSEVLFHSLVLHIWYIKCLS